MSAEAGLSFASRGADISAGGLYRYSLWRHWDPTSKRRATWIMLNPSTADESVDDPTIRKCIGFTKRLTGGFGGLVVVNLFAWRATDPAAMREARRQGHDIVGGRNDRELLRAIDTDDIVIAAWGALDRVSEMRAVAVRDIVRSRGRTLLCFGKTKAGQPRHPLMLPYSAELSLLDPLPTTAEVA